MQRQAYRMFAFQLTAQLGLSYNSTVWEYISPLGGLSPGKACFAAKFGSC